VCCMTDALVVPSVSPSMLEHRLAKLAAAATFVLLVIGGTVNPTGSSLACPEPTLLCHKQLFPPMVGGVLYALTADDDGDPGSARLRELLGQGPITDDAELAEALELLRESAAMKRARETVRGYADRARHALDSLPDGPARRALAALADVVADRTG